MNAVNELKKERNRLEGELARLDQALVLLGARALHGRIANGNRPKKQARRWSAAARARAAARMRAAWKAGKMGK